jgi:trk system potassium uptake protein TrkA
MPPRKIHGPAALLANSDIENCQRFCSNENRQAKPPQLRPIRLAFLTFQCIGRYTKGSFFTMAEKPSRVKGNRYIVIVGCGRLGSLLANRLSLEGHSVVVIDIDAAAFDALSPDFSGFHVEGDATQLAVLRNAKLEKAHDLIATTSQDNVNLMVCQVARKLFGVDHVLTRVFDPKRQKIYDLLGIGTICPICSAAEKFMEAVCGTAAGEEGSEA